MCYRYNLRAEFHHYPFGLPINLAQAFGTGPKPQLFTNQIFERNEFTEGSGALDTKYEDEAGKILGETKDGNDAVVTIADENVKQFNLEFGIAQKEEVENSSLKNESWIRGLGVEITFSETSKVQSWAVSAMALRANLKDLGLAAVGVGTEIGSNSFKGATIRLFNQKGTNFSPKIYSSGWIGGRAGQIRTFGTTNLGRCFQVGEYGLGIFNALGIKSKYESSQLNGIQNVMEHSFNLTSTIGGIYGAAWGIRWELGRAFTNSPGYHENVRPPAKNSWGYGNNYE